MADRPINCAECSKDMGIIRDAKLRKDISYLCGKCETDRSKARLEIGALKAKIRHLKMQPGNIFKDIFN